MRKKLLVYLALFFLSCLGMDKLQHVLTAGFEKHSLLTVHHYDPRFEVKINEEVDVDQLLKQPFTYFSRGSQCFVFISKDGNVLLKLFRKKTPLSSLLKTLPFPSFIKNKLLRKEEKRKHALEDFFKSCVIAFSEFKNETGLLWVHLNPTSTQKEVIVTDKIGRRHKIDLDHYAFVVQKKFSSTAETLEKLMKEGEIVKAKEALTRLFDFMAWRHCRGYSDKDPNFLKNFGFDGEKAVELDVGGFVFDPYKPKGYFYNHEIVRATQHMKEWLFKHYPDLLAHFEENTAFLFTLPE